MKSLNRILLKTLIVSIVVLILFGVLLISFALGAIGGFPELRVSLYRYYFQITKPENNKQALERLHQATKVKKDGVYTYEYTLKDRKIIRIDSAKCIVCHGKMIQLGKDKKPKYPLHYSMLTVPMLDLLCTECHKQVDFRKRGPSQMRMVKVDRAFCMKCHIESIATKDLQKNWQLFFSTRRHIAAEKAPKLPSVLELHVIRNNDGGKKWVKLHSKIAEVVGVDQCRSCHQPGSELDFCKTCHDEHPRGKEWIYKKHGPRARVNFSYCFDCHMEGEKCFSCHKVKIPHDIETKDNSKNWDKIHYLQKDRTLCLPCHKENAPLPKDMDAKDPDFCQKCHHRLLAEPVKEMGIDSKNLVWRKFHFKVVAERGHQECFQCHKLVYCAKCHVSGKKPPPENYTKFNKKYWRSDYNVWQR